MKELTGLQDINNLRVFVGHCIQAYSSMLNLYNTTFNIKVNNSYPFSFPKSYIVIDNINIEYIEWFLNTRNKYIVLINAFDIKVPCICCNTITCTWTPTMGVQNIINEIEIHYNKYYVLIQFNEIYNKINKFDNLIYKTIFDFLYFNNI